MFKHHRKHVQCSDILTQICPNHKHKICGSDGQLYSSRCHLRQAACASGVSLHPSHPDRCQREDDNDLSVESAVTESQNTSNEYVNEKYHLVNEIEQPKVNNDEDADDEECQPKQYDLMKEAVLSKSKFRISSL